MSGGCKSTDALGIFCIIRVRIICSNLTHVFSLKIGVFMVCRKKDEGQKTKLSDKTCERITTFL